jgi:ABC-type antimicrobial peptide transport system permease subunit
MSYSVASRRREIGVRVALGADARRVLALVVGEGLRLTSVGVAAGSVAAIALTRLMQGVIAGVAAFDVSVLIIGAVVMTTVACLAAWVPARRAGAVDPVVVLRE